MRQREPSCGVPGSRGWIKGANYSSEMQGLVYTIHTEKARRAHPISYHVQREVEFVGLVHLGTKCTKLRSRDQQKRPGVSHSQRELRTATTTVFKLHWRVRTKCSPRTPEQILSSEKHLGSFLIRSVLNSSSAFSLGKGHGSVGLGPLSFEFTA